MWQLYRDICGQTVVWKFASHFTITPESILKQPSNSTRKHGTKKKKNNSQRQVTRSMTVRANSREEAHGKTRLLFSLFHGSHNFSRRKKTSHERTNGPTDRRSDGHILFSLQYKKEKKYAMQTTLLVSWLDGGLDLGISRTSIFIAYYFCTLVVPLYRRGKTMFKSVWKN